MYFFSFVYWGSFIGESLLPRGLSHLLCELGKGPLPSFFYTTSNPKLSLAIKELKLTYEDRLLEESTVTVTNCLHFTLQQFPVPNVANDAEIFEEIERK